MQLMLITCLGVITDSGRCAAVGWTGGGVVGCDGKLASFCKVAAVSAKPNKHISLLHGKITGIKSTVIYTLPHSDMNIYQRHLTHANCK